jgi:CubicO group peptidase (beta-lactamase class C family)
MNPPAAELVARARRDVDDGPLPSCQFAVARAGELLAFETIGAPDAAPAGNDTRYVIYSSSKGVFASAVWAAVSDGLLSYATRVADVVPEFAANEKRDVTVDHLMTMTAGFPRAPLGPPDWLTSGGRVAAFARWRLDWEPGSRCEYHASSAHWVLAELIERSSGRDFRQYLRERVMEPLGLGLFLGSSSLDEKQLALPVAVGKPPSAQELEAVTGIAGIELPDIPDEHLLRFRDPEIRAAGQPAAGVIGTAADLALYYQALLANPGNLFDPAVLADGTAVVRTGDMVDPVRGAAALRTRGVMVAGDDGNATRRGFGRRVSPRAFGHDGMGGQVAWADPDTGISFAYLTNGLDAHLMRMARRGVALSDLACALV